MKHDERLATAFDGQAARFERAPVQTDPEALARLVAFAAFPEESRLLDAGCGPGIVSAAFLASGCRVFGVDLSAEMVARAIHRTETFGERARFARASVFDPMLDAFAPFDGAVSRFVLHHVVDPAAFITRQAALIRPGGSLLLCDHTTDPSPALAERHNQIEKLRDVTHTRNLTTGALADLLGASGLVEVRASEEVFQLDFDEWFDRGTPAAPKAEVRARLLESPLIRGFSAFEEPDGSVRIEGVRSLIRGRKVESDGRRRSGCVDRT